MNNINKQYELISREENEISILEQTEEVKNYLLKISQHQKNINDLKKALKERMLETDSNKEVSKDGSIIATITRAYSIQVDDLNKISQDFITLTPLDTSDLVFDGNDVYTKSPNLELAKAYEKNGSLPEGFKKVELTPRFHLEINGQTI